jgi:hypothetical protein
MVPESMLQHAATVGVLQHAVTVGVLQHAVTAGVLQTCGTVATCFTMQDGPLMEKVSQIPQLGVDHEHIPLAHIN